MRLQITTEQFNFNEMLILIERNLRWKIRVGYRKGRGLTPLLVASYASDYLVRNIHMNSMSANINELSLLLQGNYGRFDTINKENVILLDDVLKDLFDYNDVKEVLQTHSDTEVELKTLYPELDEVPDHGKY